MKTWQPENCGMQQKKLWGKYIAVQFYLKKQEKSLIKNLTLHLKQLEKEQQQQQTQSSQKERNHEDQIRNKWKRNEGNNNKDQ